MLRQRHYFSSTNWLLYCHWRKQNKQLNTPARRTTRKLITAHMKSVDMNVNQITSLVTLWSVFDPIEFGVNLIGPVCKERSHLRRFIYTKSGQGNLVKFDFCSNEMLFIFCRRSPFCSFNFQRQISQPQNALQTKLKKWRWLKYLLV